MRLRLGGWCPGIDPCFGGEGLCILGAAPRHGPLPPPSRLAHAGRASSEHFIWYTIMLLLAFFSC